MSPVSGSGSELDVEVVDVVPVVVVDVVPVDVVPVDVVLVVPVMGTVAVDVPVFERVDVATVAVIFTMPPFFPVTTPSLETEAIVASLDFQVSVMPAVLEMGWPAEFVTLMETFWVAPTATVKVAGESVTFAIVVDDLLTDALMLVGTSASALLVIWSAPEQATAATRRVASINFLWNTIKPSKTPFGNPTGITTGPIPIVVASWLCVPAFRRVCLYRGPLEGLRIGERGVRPSVRYTIKRQ